MNPLYVDLDVEITTLMQSLGLGTPGVDIFNGELPQGTVKGFFIVPSQSPSPELYIDHEYLVIDFWYRSPYTNEAKAKMRELYSKFHRAYNTDTANWHIFFSEALGGVMDMDRDAEGGKLLKLSVQFICRNINSIS
jgi:hypothetical protein